MPAVLEIHPAQLPPGARRKLTREDCRALSETGRIEAERYELIDGELIRKTAKSPLHIIALQLLVEWLGQVFGPRYVRQESPIDLNPALDPNNEPEPDALVLRQPTGE